MKIVGMYPEPFEAELAKGRLEAEGIEARLLNEYINSTMPWGSTLDRAVRLAVADEDYEKAMKVLTPASEDEGISGRGRVCPFCGSERVALGLRGPKQWKKIAWGILAVLTMSPAGNVGPNYYCQECRQEF